MHGQYQHAAVAPDITLVCPNKRSEESFYFLELLLLP